MLALAPPLSHTQWDRNKAGWEALKPRLHARWPTGWEAGRLGSAMRACADKGEPRCPAEAWGWSAGAGPAGSGGVEQPKARKILWWCQARKTGALITASIARMMKSHGPSDHRDSQANLHPLLHHPTHLSAPSPHLSIFWAS